MTELLKNGLMILSGIIGGCLFIVIRNLILNKAKQKLVSGQTIEQEPFSLAKFVQGMTALKTGTGWAKDLHDLFNLRKLIIVGVILSCIWGYGYYKGKINKPVQLVISEEVEFTIPVPHSDLALYHPKHSTQLQWINTVTGKVISIVKVSEIPELAKKLHPYGFIFEPIAVIGAGAGTETAGFEGGIGVRYLKYFKWVADICLTNKGIYPFGVSYKLTDNSAIGLSVGSGFKGNDIGLFKRFLLKFSIKF
jgi:hypothetical protein